MRRGLGAVRLLALLAATLAPEACVADCLKHADSKPPKVGAELVTVPTRLLLAHAETRVTPTFPREAIQAKVDGSVIIALEVDHEGRVTQTLPLSGPKMLYPSAEEALKQWRFESFCKHGVPYVVRSAVEFQFRWRGDGSRHLPE